MHVNLPIIVAAMTVSLSAVAYSQSRVRSRELLSCWHPTAKVVTSSAKKLMSNDAIKANLQADVLRCKMEDPAVVVPYDPIAIESSEIKFTGPMSFITSKQYRIKYETQARILCMPSLGPGSAREKTTWYVEKMNELTYDDFPVSASDNCSYWSSVN